MRTPIVFGLLCALLLTTSIRAAESAPITLTLDASEIDKQRIEARLVIPVKPGPKFAGAIAAFGKLRPGSTFPRHAHQGEELTLVMAGGFRDSSGVEIERGDELFEADGSEHDFTVLEGEDCIAAVIVHGSIDLK